MKIAMFVAKDAALRRGSDTHGWWIADVSAVLIPERDREFLIAYCPPTREFESPHDYAVQPTIRAVPYQPSSDTVMPPAPDPKGIDTQSLLQYLLTCRELVKEVVAAYEAAKAQEQAEEEAQRVSEKKKYETLAVRVLAGEFPDERLSTDSCRIRIDVSDTSDLYVYRCESEIVDKAFDYTDEAVKRFQAVLKAREAKEAAEVAAYLAKKKSIISGLLKKYGSVNQIERWEAGCLPEEELNEILHNIAHSDLQHCPRYVKITSNDVEHVDHCCVSEIWYGVDDEPDSVTEKAWEEAKGIRALLKPGTDNRIRLHKAHCRAEGCDMETRKYALQVRIEIPGVGMYAREYELDGMFKVQL